MNQESVFALRFVMKDFAKMRKGIEQINKNLEQMKENANKASGGMDKLTASIGKTIRSIGKFALAYFALSKIINTTFKKVQESIQIDLMAQSAGVAAEKIGKLGKALRMYGGDAKSAGSAYNSLIDIIGGAQHGMGISQDVARVNAMYGIGFNYGNISQDELLTNIAIKMKELRGKGDQWAINQIASAYGLDASMAEFLTKHGSKWSSKANQEEWKKLSVSETQQLINAQDSLEQEIANFGTMLMPLLKDLVDGVKTIAAWINDKINKSQPIKDDKGNVVAVKAGRFGTVPILSEEDKKNKKIPSIVPNEYSDTWNNWMDYKQKFDIEEENAKKLKEKYNDVRGIDYSYNKWFGEHTYVLDLTIENNSPNEISVKKTRQIGNGLTKVAVNDK